MEKKLVQRCETEVDGDACKALYGDTVPNKDTATSLIPAENSGEMMISYQRQEITGAASTDEQSYSSGVCPGDIHKYESFVRS